MAGQTTTQYKPSLLATITTPAQLLASHTITITKSLQGKERNLLHKGVKFTVLRF